MLPIMRFPCVIVMCHGHLCNKASITCSVYQPQRKKRFLFLLHLSQHLNLNLVEHHVSFQCSPTSTRMIMRPATTLRKWNKCFKPWGTSSSRSHISINPSWNLHLCSNSPPMWLAMGTGGFGLVWFQGKETELNRLNKTKTKPNRLWTLKYLNQTI